ncbi:hypothetical protein BP5796_13030 [Coleophoma crateriformis]|uniref:Citrate synthase n=1 Tax=Coleophoma crateriformis TaxID=565419 RepID=A0A3D8Q576_9HELO|nr:hypothetical protein BP5796_13030 [Coleophoma crateriformis]
MTSVDGELSIEDSRTSAKYRIPIRNNSILAADLVKIRGPKKGKSLTKNGDGLLLFDNGLQYTAIKKSKISARDAATGMPLYRGYSMEKLTEMGADFEDLFHLMVLGSYPNAEEREWLRAALAKEMMEVPDAVVKVVQAFPRDSPAMSMLLAGLSAYISAYPHGIPALQGSFIYHANPRLADKAAIKTTAAYAVVLGLVSCHRKRIPFKRASASGTFYSNLFTMMGMVGPNDQVDPKILDLFKRGAIYNADNGMTHSTFVLLTAASAFPDPISCLTSAVAAAYGPLHYGAQEAMWNNLQSIGAKENVPAFLEKVKRKERRLFGYGHRAFAVEDPRLKPVMGWLRELNVSEKTQPLFGLANEIDRVASKDEYFRTRGLSANADFYTAFYFNAM